jgi:hypothetical protein
LADQVNSLVGGGVLRTGDGNALASKLSAAAAGLSAGNTTAG